MIKELELWQFTIDALRRGDNVMLLVVAESIGSSPGRQGFKMAVTPGGMCGSIGGGIMEVNLVDQARTILSVPPAVVGGLTTPSNFISPQTHQKNSTNASGMICSGKQTVIFYRFNVSHLKTVEKIIASLKNRSGETLSIDSTDLRIDALPAESDFSFSTSSDTDFHYRERLGAKNELYIIGGGHCALALSELMSKMDFYIRIFDDRPDLNTIEKNTFADEKHVIEGYENIAANIREGENVYVVVMTLGFASDEVVIRQLVHKDLKYFGVLGSRAKMAVLLKNLRLEDVPEVKLAAVHTPIGISINSQTPEEIAVSIAAEIIAVKNSGL